ncbi:SMP-30/gluconolactonase/LRE family protein [Xanthovirga aplysinae]|uniref:SMP-30/gluconolactonase/LRE family protein n=1 Tax=Xanthovirga aplysinae TaxID=2529853 RepID=UPI0016569EE8|nr:SMP-30/gluconolactonase/LRE family protein [Xanthovirga aplysinae]
MKTFFTILVLTTLMACHKKDTPTTTLNFEEDLMPEGITIDPQSKTLFLNSMKYNKIVASKLDGSEPGNFIENNEYGYLSGFGMTIKGDTLYALGDSYSGNNNQSILLLLNVKTGDLVDSYTLQDTTFTLLNDLAISSNNEIFITETRNNKIYKIQRPNKVLEVYLDSEEIAHPNGISISEDNKYLYVASRTKGIRIIDISSKKILNESNKDLGGVDGLKYYNNSLIGIVNAKRDVNEHGVFRYFLSKEGDSITHIEKIIPYGENFEVPTTLDIVDGHLYYITQSQLLNYNYETKEVLDTTKLKPYVLMKKRIE